jgi:hypothetical protein
MVQIWEREEKDMGAASGRWWPIKRFTLVWNSISITLNIGVLKRVVFLTIPFYCYWPRGSSISSFPPWI